MDLFAKLQEIGGDKRIIALIPSPLEICLGNETKTMLGSANGT